MRYETATGDVFHLVYYSPAEWADRVETSFKKLGCTDEYARRAADRYRQEMKYAA